MTSRGGVPENEFDLYADGYHHLVDHPMRRRFARNPRFYVERKMDVLRGFLRRVGRELSKTSWLDVGCGKGELLELGSGEMQRVAGCDPSAEMLKRSPLAGLHVLPPTGKVPFEDASFDLVTTVCVYHHVPPQERRVLGDEAVRVLKPNGLFCVMEHNPWNPVARAIVRRCPVDRNAVLLSMPELIRTVSQSGLTAVDRCYFLLLPQSLYPWLWRIEHSLSSVPLGGQYAVLFRKPG